MQGALSFARRARKNKLALRGNSARRALEVAPSRGEQVFCASLVGLCRRSVVRKVSSTFKAIALSPLLSEAYEIAGRISSLEIGPLDLALAWLERAYSMQFRSYGVALDFRELMRSQGGGKRRIACWPWMSSRRCFGFVRSLVRGSTSGEQPRVVAIRTYRRNRAFDSVCFVYSLCYRCIASDAAGTYRGCSLF